MKVGVGVRVRVRVRRAVVACHHDALRRADVYGAGDGGGGGEREIGYAHRGREARARTKVLASVADAACKGLWGYV